MWSNDIFLVAYSYLLDVHLPPVIAFPISKKIESFSIPSLSKPT